MKLTILFLLISIVCFFLSKLYKNTDDNYQWIPAQATILSENEGEVNINYYAQANIDGKIQNGVSIHYKKSEIFYEKGDKVDIVYHLIPGTFNTFEFKILNDQLEEINKNGDLKSILFLIGSIVSFVLAIGLLFR